MPAGIPGSVEKKQKRNREYMRKHGPSIRERKAAVGICRDCRNPRIEGRTMCENCLAKNRERVKRTSRNLRHLRAKRGRCRECGHKAESNCKFCGPCLAKAREANAKRYSKVRGDGLCGICRKDAASRGSRCEGCYEKARIQLIAIKREVMDAYGGKCTCCGEQELGFLTIDHSNDNGNRHRQEIPGASIYHWLKKVGFPKDDYQCMCFNCNLGRAKNGGVCPHKAPQ